MHKIISFGLPTFINITATCGPADLKTADLKTADLKTCKPADL